MKLTALVGKVDMNGYCGRSPHPEPTMERLWLPVVKMGVEELGDHENPYAEYIVTVRVPVSALTEMDGDERVVTGPDGERWIDVELLPHELRDLRVSFDDEPDVKP